MGYYIEGPTKGKAVFLHHEHGAQACDCPDSFSDIPEDQALICVVDNGPFEAAGYCFDEREFEAFTYPDPRPKSWMVMDKKLAEKLSHFSS